MLADDPRQLAAFRAEFAGFDIERVSPRAT
jgi:hypothetical protein